MTDFTLTVKRDDLIKALEDKHAALEREFEATLKPLREAKKEEDDAASNFKKWHLDVAALVRKGEAEFEANGKVAVTQKGAQNGVSIPAKPTGRKTSRSRYRHTTEASWQLESVEAQRKRTLGALESSLRILRLAQDDEVQIKASEYEKLLNLTAETHF